MPIINTFQPGPTKEHTGSCNLFESVPLVSNAKFKQRFGIPEGIPTGGIVFNTESNYLPSKIGRGILSSLIKDRVGLEPHKISHFNRTIEVVLPTDTFASGTLTFTGESGTLRSEIRFDGDPRNAITYNTGLGEGENLAKVLPFISVLSAIPSEVLALVEGEKPLVVVSQSIPADDEYIGYKYATIMQLRRDEEGVICASGVDVPDTNGVKPEEELYEEAARATILNSSGVYFILDGYYPGIMELG